VTIFTCTWIAIHPNIPGPDEKWTTVGLRRLGIMGAALMAPELVIAWAVRQWMVSVRLMKKYEGVFIFSYNFRFFFDDVVYEWTQTQGLHALMGGFMLFTGKQPLRTLDPHELDIYLQQGKIDVSEKDIRDRSKGSGLSKAIVVVQTGWFTLQCIGRKSQGLALTGLEVVTLGFGLLNLVTYLLWWNKPLNVHCPVPVYAEPTSTSQVKRLEAISGVLVRARSEIQSSVTSISGTVDRVIGKGHDGPSATVFNGVGLALRYLFWPVWRVFSMGFEVEDDVIGIDAKRVPTFYSGFLEPKETWIVVLASMIFATIFGWIHCAAWNFSFPTEIEQHLWRISSLVLTCVPTVLLMGGIFLGCVADVAPQWLKDLLVLIVFFATCLLYGLARATLLTLALSSLRSLPPSAYKNVLWTTFIPHI
jgi:hypothetical protein